nr:hypothetical protein [uncultured Devosia sp.]
MTKSTSFSYRPRLRRWAAAEYLGDIHGVQIAPSTLAKLASVGGGPAITYFSKIPLYALADLDDWAFSKLHLPTSSTSETPVPLWIGNEPDLEP